MGVLDANNFVLCGLVTLAWQLGFFVVAASWKFDKVTDLAGGSNFVIIAVLSLSLSNFASRAVLVTSMVAVWGVRLSGYLFYRILMIGSDNRFDGKRENVLRFAAFWCLQAMWVYLVSLPVMIINSPLHGNQRALLTASDILGTLLWIVGFAIEAIADHSKFVFKQDATVRRKWCDVGIWHYSRHPNYFGEILLWIGIFFIGSSVYASPLECLLGALSPIFITSILLFLSGIPLLEKAADDKWGSKEEYVAYKASTSPLVPLPPAVYGRLPMSVKRVCLFEFPFYSTGAGLREPLRRRDS